MLWVPHPLRSLHSIPKARCLVFLVNDDSVATADPEDSSVIGVTSLPVAVASVTNPAVTSLPAPAVLAEGEQPSTSGTPQLPATVPALDVLPAG